MSGPDAPPPGNGPTDTSPPAGRLVFAPCPPDQAPARDLLEAMVAELVELYDIAGGTVGVPLHHSELAPPGGTYLVGRTQPGGEVVAGGGLRTIGAGVGEIKRMYVVPEWRGRGVARILLAALEDAARDLGLDRVRLDTGSRQPDARHVYQTSGYRTIGNYNDNPHATYWGEKRL